MIRVDVDMLDLDVILFHVNQNVIPGFYSTQIIVQADEADLAEQTDHFHALVVSPHQIIRAVAGNIPAVIQNNFYRYPS